MKTKLPAFARSYLEALRHHLEDGSATVPASAKELGLRAVDLGLDILDLAKVHEEALIDVVSPDEAIRGRKKLIRHAGKFFADAIAPIELTHQGSLEANRHLKIMVDELVQRTDDLADSNQVLLNEINQRKTLEESLRASEQKSSKRLEKSRALQIELRLLSRRLISVQEEERKRISRELHDLIAQTLTGINLQLEMLKVKAVSDAKEFDQKIERTQQQIETSVDAVHRFARDLRPAVLDDLGLIPALKAFLKGFLKDTGIRVSLTAFAGVEKLSSVDRTVLYRVAQEALNNTSQHAEASRAEVGIHQLEEAVSMKIHDDGKGFPVDSDAFLGEQSERLGLLGMRERVEMVGGTFRVQSAPGQGTTVCVEIPSLDTKTQKPRLNQPARTSPTIQMSAITILLAEDHTIVREGLRALLASENDIEIIGEGGDGRTIVKLATKLRPDVVVMDIAMPQMNGIEATRQILRELPETKIIILSAHSDDAYVEQVMALGAKGYLIKQSAAHALAESIRRVFRGETCFTTPNSKRLHRHDPGGQVIGESDTEKTASSLTSRESEVLQLIAEGMANKQTADVLHISIKTVEKHRQTLMNKLGIHDTAGLTRYAIAAGIIESSVQVTIL